jgi:hypothetical protein
MSTAPWERTCKRCGRIFEVGLWCLEVTYCDPCKAELKAMPAKSLEDSPHKHDAWCQTDNPGLPETESDRQDK